MSLAAARDLYRSTFQQEPIWASFAPGRVNLIGEHTDYQGGFVFPAALTMGVTVVAGPSINTSRLISRQAGPANEFIAGEMTNPGGWAQYPAGTSWAVGAKTNIQAAVVSDVPLGSGLSSSAAIELAFAVLWNDIDELGLSPKQLALAGQKAENQVVGVQCGIMDQLASAAGAVGHALLIDTDSLDIQAKPMPENLDIVICDTGRTRALTAGDYNARREAVEEASRRLGVKNLRQAKLSDLNPVDLPELLYPRAHHVVTENQRCLDFAAALENGELSRLAELMAQSHASLRNDYEVSCRQLDLMVDAALASPGCVGARLTGAGFGGAVVALVESEKTELFIPTCQTQYNYGAPSFLPQFFVGRPGPGASILNL